MPGIVEAIDRMATFFLVLEKIPGFGKIFKIFQETGGEIIEKKIKETLGLDTDAAAKDIEDEILYGVALNSLDPTEKLEISNFEIKLRESEAKKAEAFVLWVAKIVKAFEITHKKTPSTPEGSKDPKVETTRRDITVGVEHAVKFIRDVLTRTGSTTEETFTARVAFLQGKNVFSLITPAKSPSSVVSAAKKIGKKTCKTIAKNQRANAADLQNGLAEAKARYEKSKVDRATRR